MKGRRENGKIMYHSVYALTLAECKQKLLAVKVLYPQERVGVKLYGTGKVVDFMTYWLQRIVKTTIKVSTFANYTLYLNKWLLPYFGGKQLSKLEPEQIQHFLSELTAAGLSAGSVRNIFRLLNSILKAAKLFGYLHRNPCERVVLPDYQKPKASVLTFSQQRQLEQVTTGSGQAGLVVELALYTGLRIGELCALTWADVDFHQQTLTVSQTRQRIQVNDVTTSRKTQVINGSTKSSSSHRQLPLSPVLVKLLGKLVVGQSATSPIFSQNSKPLEPRVIQYQFQKLLAKANLASFNFHTLRHTFATRCLEQGVDIKTLSELLGHASAVTTLKLYSHSCLKQKQLAMERLNQLHPAG
jgi:integrase